VPRLWGAFVKTRGVTKKMPNFYIFNEEGDSLRVEIEKRNEGIFLSLGEFHMKVDYDSAMEIAESLIEEAESLIIESEYDE